LKGLFSVKNRRQALWFFLNTAIVVVVRVSNQLGFEVFERIELEAVNTIWQNQPQPSAIKEID